MLGILFHTVCYIVWSLLTSRVTFATFQALCEVFKDEDAEFVYWFSEYWGQYRDRWGTGAKLFFTLTTPIIQCVVLVLAAITLALNVCMKCMSWWDKYLGRWL